MFNNIPESILTEMRRLEEIDARDRADGTPRMKRLRQIPSDTGKFLAILAANSPNGDIIEIGTSAGYSALWLALACRAGERTMTTFELLDDKFEMAQETFNRAGVSDVVKAVKSDARELIRDFSNIAFCFLDAEKESYLDCYELVVERLVPGGLLVADNIISHQKELQPFVDVAIADRRVDAVVVPIGKGELLVRKI
jgi:predicted O-methyltransferase YrrM